MFVSQVRVAIVASLRASPKEKPQFSSGYAQSSPVLELADPSKSRFTAIEDLRLACELAVVNAVMARQQTERGQAEYTITLIQGTNLTDDCTIGFAIAAMIAVNRVSPRGGRSGEDLNGWSEVLQGLV